MSTTATLSLAPTVFPHAKREQIRQALLDAHEVYRLQHLLGANVCGLTFSHEIGGRLYTIEMHRSKDNLWQMRVPRASKVSFFSTKIST